MKWYLKVFRQFSDFEGRASRREYWMFILFNSIFAFAAIILDNLLGITIGAGSFGPLYALYGLTMFIPTWAVSVRRLHDSDKSGWMMLISVIPLIGSIWILILMAKSGDPSANSYGPSSV